MSLLETVRATIKEYRLLSKGDTVIVAVSGGADSTALLHFLSALRNEWDLALIVAHLDHQLRPDSADDAGFVGRIARALGVEAVISVADVRALARRHKLSIEEAGREARYEFLRNLAHERGAQRVATAHTHDDQVETVLMRLLRGDPWEALGGIPVRRPLGRAHVIRPLLRVRREDLRRYLTGCSIEWKEDPSNRDLRFDRNWIRLRVVPELERTAPTVRDVLTGMAETIRSADGLLSDLVSGHVDTVADATPNLVQFPLGTFRRFPPPVQRRMIEWAVSRIAGTPAGLPAVMGERALRFAAKGQAGDAINLGSSEMRVNYEALEFARPQPPKPVTEYRLKIPGTVHAEEFGMTLTATVVDVPLTRLSTNDSNAVHLDAGLLSGELRIRSWRAGDQLVPLGMRGKKKVQDVFVDDKVPRWERHRTPVVTDMDGRIVWIVGRRLAATARISVRTRHAVRLSARPAGRNNPPRPARSGLIEEPFSAYRKANL